MEGAAAGSRINGGKHTEWGSGSAAKAAGAAQQLSSVDGEKSDSSISNRSAMR